MRIMFLVVACVLVQWVGLPRAESAQANPLYDFFPFGMYLVGPNPVSGVEGDLAEKVGFTCADLKEHNFNCIWANNLGFAAHLDTWLQAGKEYGIRVIPQGGGPPDLLRPDYTFENGEYFENTVVPHWANLALKYRDNQTLLAYSLEEECPPHPLSRYRAIDRLTRLTGAIDPSHPMIVMYNQVTSAELAAQMVKPKAIAYDAYPFFSDPENGPDTRGGSLSYYIVNQERMYRAARKSGGPLWMIAQGIVTDILHKGKPDKPLYRQPGPNEMRWQVWCSLYCGAKGVFFYVYSTGPFERPEFNEGVDEIYWERGMVDQEGTESSQYREAAQVSREIDPIKPLFLKLDWARPEENVIYWIESEYVLGRTFVHRDTGARYLVLFNSDPNETHPAAVELNRFAEEVAHDTKTYDVRAQKMLSSAWPDKELKELMIGPGDGAVVLILDEEDTLDKHKAQYEK